MDVWRRRWLPAVLVAAALAAWPACQSRSGPAEGAARLDFTLKDMAGKDVRLSDFAGRPIVLNFWATWCGPCRIEIPWFVELQDRYRDRGLVILGISTDDEPEDLRQFAADFKMNYPVLVGLGHDELLRTYDAVDVLPITWFVKPDGTIAGKGTGLHPQQWFDEQIKALF
jgi:cytochrome c biogenesis protein CcmG/thiol:disulfide interchange protein DsbE